MLYGKERISDNLNNIEKQGKIYKRVIPFKFKR